MFSNHHFSVEISLIIWGTCVSLNTVQKIKFSITGFFVRCNQIHSFLQIWSHLLKKSVMENLIFLRGENSMVVKGNPVLQLLRPPRTLGTHWNPETTSSLWYLFWCFQGGVEVEQPSTLLKVTLHHGCFSHFLNYTNVTKSCKASHVNKTKQFRRISSCQNKNMTSKQDIKVKTCYIST